MMKALASPSVLNICLGNWRRLMHEERHLNGHYWPTRQNTILMAFSGGSIGAWDWMLVGYINQTSHSIHVHLNDVSLAGRKWSALSRCVVLPYRHRRNRNKVKNDGATDDNDVVQDENIMIGDKIPLKVQNALNLWGCFIVRFVWQPYDVEWIHGLEVIKLVSCSTQLSMKCILLINIKMPTIVGIFYIYKHDWFNTWGFESKKSLHLSTLLFVWVVENLCSAE